MLTRKLVPFLIAFLFLWDWLGQLLSLKMAGNTQTIKPQPIPKWTKEQITLNITNSYKFLHQDEIHPWKTHIIANHTDNTQIFYAKFNNFIAKYLNITLVYENEHTFELIIKDHNRSSHEIPYKDPFPHRSFLNFNEKNFSQDSLAYKVDITEEPFSISIKRRVTDEVIFDTNLHNLLLSKQYLEIGSAIPTEYIFGMGERNFQYRLTPGIYTLWARDEVGDVENGKHPGHNSYGVHPMYLMKEKSGNYHVNFLRSSNPFDFIVGNDSINYKIAGGIIHFKFFLGDIFPETAVKLYHEYIGGFAVPPFWALGFHQSRWGYSNIQDLRDSLEGHKRNDIPIEAIWLDIDYMYDYIPFTIDAKRFSPIKLKNLKAEFNVRIVSIIDPAIPYKNSDPFRALVNQGSYIRDMQGQPFIGRLYSGESIWPDFFHPKINLFWTAMFLKLHENVPFDGIWLDMNEPTSFCDGACMRQFFRPDWDEYEREAYFIGEDIRNLPYVPGNRSLEVKSLALNALHYPNRMHVDVHSLYGLLETYETHRVLKERFGEHMPFILTRNTFVGSGAYSAHWSGDNLANWEFLRLSIPATMNSNMFGIPMVGDDICGFFGNTTEMLCARWIQLSSLYPFTRNHNHKEFADHQFHNLGPMIAKLAKKAFKFKYSILKYYYSIFLEKKNKGMIVKPLFYHYISDPHVFEDKLMNSQFMIGDRLMVTPVLTHIKEHIKAYFPKDTWYDFHTGKQLTDQSNPSDELLVYSGLEDLAPIFIRGGSVVPLQDTVNVSNTNELGNNFHLHIFLNRTNFGENYASASGKLIDIDNLNNGKEVLTYCLQSEEGCLYNIDVKIVLAENSFSSTTIRFYKEGGAGKSLSKTNSISKLVFNNLDTTQILFPLENSPINLDVFKQGSIIKRREGRYHLHMNGKNQIRLTLEFEPIFVQNELEIFFNFGLFKPYDGVLLEDEEDMFWTKESFGVYMQMVLSVYVCYIFYHAYAFFYN